MTKGKDIPFTTKIQIYTHAKAGKSAYKIAQILGVSKNTALVSRFILEPEWYGILMKVDSQLTVLYFSLSIKVFMLRGKRIIFSSQRQYTLRELFIYYIAGCG